MRTKDNGFKSCFPERISFDIVIVIIIVVGDTFMANAWAVPVKRAG